MDTSLLIALFVPTTNEQGDDFKGKEGEWATGYPVGKDLILTARHILQPEPPYYRDNRYRVALRWHYFLSNDDSGWIEIPEENIVYPNQGNLDAVLIRCSRPPDARGWGIVSCEKPRNDVAWESVGFARATKAADIRNPRNFGGQVRAMAGQDTFFELIENTPPEKDEDWKGASGMPVVVGGRILGVMQSVPPNFKAKKLHATPTWKLLEDQGFRKTIGYDEQAARINKIKAKLVKLLKPAPEAVEALIEQLESDDEMAGLAGEERVETLAKRLLQETDIRTLIEALRRAHRSLCEDVETAQERAKAAETVTKAAQLIVPTLYDYGVIHWIRNQQGSGGAALVPLPAGIKTVAEIIMAGVDNRETRFRHRQHEDDQPEGELSLPQLPECGLDPGGVAAREALQRHVERKFNPRAMENFRSAVDDYLLTHFRRPGRGAPERSREQRIKLTASLLASKSRDSGQTFYMMFYPPDNAEGQRAMRTLIQSLKDDYPAIMFLSLSPTFEQALWEQELVDPLCRMLPLRESATALSSPATPEDTFSMSSQRFKIALSYPGERRNFVERVAARLAEQVGRERVLYDRYYEAEFARPDLDLYLQRLYLEESELIAIFLGADYENKEWCGLEWRVVRELLKKRRTETVMPLRFDNTEIPGLFSTDGYLWIGERRPEEIADLILQRMGIGTGHTGASSRPNLSRPTAASPPPSALDVWRQKLAFLQWEEAKVVEPAQKFKLQQDIAEARDKIRELGGQL